MKFVDFAANAVEIENEPTDYGIVELVADLFETADDDLAIVTRFVQGRVYPAHDGTKLDIGPNLCYRALAKAAGPNVTAADIETKLAAVGEIGAVAAALDLGGQQGLAAFGSGNRDELTIAEVDETLRTLAVAEGSGSTGTKLDTLFGLFTRCEPIEARILARLVLGEMRIGVGEGTVRDSIAEAFDVPEAAVARALQVSNDCGLVAETARADGKAGLIDIHLAIGRPIKPMLAQAGTAVDALESWESVGVETKYDGARVQVHYDGETVRLFSRNLENVTEPLPEVVDTVSESIDVPAILDGEVIAVDADGSTLPFQNVLRRFRRKHDIAAARDDIAVELRAFDCLHVDGTDLLDSPLTERHDRLEALLDSNVSTFEQTTDPETIADLEAETLDQGHEGIMLKNPQSSYTPGDRGQNWLKRKPDVETLDLVVTGAEWGEGRRANLLGTFLLSVRTDDDYETIGKVATGITDEKLEDLHERLQPYVRAEQGTTVDIEPVVVFEVGYEEIQESPTYSSGYALRFPRFVGVREDKDSEDVDTLERVERLTQ